ncbi:MAG: hypothetical protein ABIH85_01190 [Candidatus Omnitrophota bacterium]|nr:hypothetical protein [Candidatus Omnitrophota bacterium]MBU1894675.1 hypothetical protein [Candidatus Omnitrophota bacterium]
MDASLFIARIFGLVYLIVGIGLLFNRKLFQQVMVDFCKNLALVLFGGMFALIVGIAIILVHNVWVPHWTVIITIIGWLGLIKGIWIIVFPKSMAMFMRRYQENENLVTVHAFAAIILGVVLTFFGFFMI